ncbi:hypothetical protein PoB_001033800 [Plakobranchus ocellatus]|uniref:Uncharacterized protein n=1 Tax=Plakobranchus ocellatus TaxID=259542 RepID=A0AAV3YNB3_9GAST|nr:hypothetical protein PoB_001033800 [Plakobranchus ocellatus]
MILVGLLVTDLPSMRCTSWFSEVIPILFNISAYIREIVMQTAQNIVRKDRGSQQFSDILATGSPRTLSDIECVKNPGHTHFIPATSLTAYHLPQHFQDERWVAMIRARLADTVKLMVRYTSPHRQNQRGYEEYIGTIRPRWGSGTAFWPETCTNQIECPLPGCNTNGERHFVYGPFQVVTVAHLVFDENEANATRVEFFDDDPHCPEFVRQAEVIGIKQGPPGSNISILKCITHDSKIPEELKKANRHRTELLKGLCEPEGASMVVMISHPHGTSKCISFGNLIQLFEKGPVKTTRDGKMRLRECTLNYSTPSCVGSGGGSVTLWQSGRRAFAPHSKALGLDSNMSAFGWVSK